MEVMDTSLDKFYKLVFNNGQKMPEDIVGKVAHAVRPVTLNLHLVTNSHHFKTYLQRMHEWTCFDFIQEST